MHKQKIYINLAVEDALSQAILNRILTYSHKNYTVRNCYRRGGFGYLKKNIRGFNNAAKFIPFLVLTDLDKTECAPTLIREWLPMPKDPNLIFRVAIREVESWLLADSLAFANFLGIRHTLIPSNTDKIEDPKQFLINLARKSGNKTLRESIIPRHKSTAKIGPNYNGALIKFIKENWNINEALKKSPSLKRTVEAIEKFKPQL